MFVLFVFVLFVHTYIININTGAVATHSPRSLCIVFYAEMVLRGRACTSEYLIIFFIIIIIIIIINIVILYCDEYLVIDLTVGR